MLITEVRILLHNSGPKSSSSHFNILLRLPQISNQLLRHLKTKNLSHYSTCTNLAHGNGFQKNNAGKSLHPRQYNWAYHDMRKGFGGHLSSLEIRRVCCDPGSARVRTFSTSSGLNSPTDGKSKTGGSSKAISKQEGRGDGQVTLSVGEKVKENAKTASYGGVILLGIIVTCGMGYFILSELLSQDSPNNIYTKSIKLCKANQEVQDSLGGPIKCYGEETRKGWRRHVAHQQFLHGDTKILRMRFYLEGKFNKATVHVEKKGNVKGKYEYSYLVVDVDGYPPRRINIDT